MNLISILFFCILCANIHSQQILREYTAKKDYFNGLKSGEFSIYDRSGTLLLFRLESNYGFIQSAELFAYPRRQLVGSIKRSWSLWLYDAEIHILDMFYNQWIPGRISQVYSFLGTQLNIQYGNRRLILEQRPFSFTMEIRDELRPNYIFARIRKRISSLFLTNTYDIQVYTNELPDLIYFLSLAATDNMNGKRARSSQNGIQKNK